jgi:hypothetical protein
MAQIEQVAKAVLARDGLKARSLTQDFFRERAKLADIPKPKVADEQVLVMTAALLELFASRMKQEAPPWTAEVGPLSEPIFLLKAAERMQRLRRLCETEAPEPLKKRRLYAPPNYLEFV